jgi:hypothetical protein
MNEIEKNSLLSSVKKIVLKARQITYNSNNTILLNMYWEIGKLIVEDEQQGRPKAAYGKATLKALSKQFTLEFGKGFDESNLRNIRQFYLAFQKRDPLRPELSWTHYRILYRIENEKLRLQYMKYAIDDNWDTRSLQRNLTTQYIERIVAPDVTETRTSKGMVKDPYVFELF